jgi:hypothetical protein
VPPPVLVPLAGAALHPITDRYELPVSPLVAADVAAALVLVVAIAWPERERDPRADPAHARASWAGSLSAAQALTRAVAVGILALAVAAGRLGVDDELENLAPALVVGTLWPVLVIASLVLGPVWRWVDPWDAIARALARDEGGEAPGHVWPAVALALAWVWYLGAYADPLDPRAVGTMLAVYSLVTVAGCLAVGRARWLGSAEPLGIVLTWTALLPRRRLTSWRPPHGAEALLGALIGGVLFGAVRRSELWGTLNTVPHAELAATAGVLAAAGLVAGFLMLLATGPRHPSRDALTRAAVPAVAAVIVAVAMDRNRLTTSIQLLPGLLGDPLGEGWDLLGRAGGRLDPTPLGITGLLVAQLAVLVAGHVTAAVVLARSLPRRDRAPVAAGLALLAAASVIALVSH